MSALVVLWRFFSPMLRERHASKTKLDEANAGLATSLVSTTRTQNELLDRTVAMADEHGKKLDTVAIVVVDTAARVKEHASILHEIRDRVVVARCRSDEMRPA